MSDYLISVLLGVIEGVTEFLPVSSTAHLRIAQSLLGIDLENGFWKMYAIVIQLGAILCLPIHFRRELISLVRTFPRGARGDRDVLTHPLSLALIASFVTIVPAYLLHKKVERNLESLTVMSLSLIVGGIIMWIVDAWCTRPRVLDVEEMGLARAIWIGAAQVVAAVFPGTSRSMATIAAGQLAGASRPSALKFSFYLSIPTMAAATGYDFLKTVVLNRAGVGQTAPPIEMTSHQWIVLLIGFVVSFLVAWGVVTWFMRWVRRHGFAPFAIYRIVIGLVLLISVFRS